MSGENYSFDERSLSKRRSIVQSLVNSSWNYKVSIIVLILAACLNFTLLFSVPVGFNNEFFYKLSTIIVDYYTPPGPAIGDNIRPVYLVSLSYTSMFHLFYWLMTGLLFLAGSGLLVHSTEELVKIIRSYYLITSVVSFFGLFKLLYLFMGLTYFRSENLLEQTIFLTIYPLVLLLPIHLILKRNQETLYATITSIGNKRKAILLFFLMLLSVVLIAFIYLGIQKIIL